MAQQNIQIHTAAPSRQVHGEHTCGCAHDDATPVFDVRPVPHAVRHGAVFGAFAATPPGSALVIVAPHDPLPLLAQLQDRFDLEISYDVSGPESWHVRLTRLS